MTKLQTTFSLALVVPLLMASADALSAEQRRGGNSRGREGGRVGTAVRRSQPPRSTPRVIVTPRRYGYGYGYYPYGFGGLGFAGYYGGFHDPWYSAYSGYYPAYGPVYRGGYGPYPARAYAYDGGVKFKIDRRDAAVYVDGYYAGVVDDFDGALQQLNVEPGPHRIEVRAPGFETLGFDVHVQPGRTVTYRGQMRQIP